MLAHRRYPYTPQLGWSVSRYHAFATCRRQYYYSYYAKFDREYPLPLITQLKQLTTLPMETGNVVHGAIAAVLQRLLRSPSDIDRGRFAGFVEDRVRARVRSADFAEVYYHEMEAVALPHLLPGVQECLDAFLDSQRYIWVRDEAMRPGHGNEWLIEPEGFGECRIAGRKAYCKVDFAFLVGGQLTILDWKSGRRDEAKHAHQLLAYAAWAVHEQGLLPAQVQTVAAYLRPAYSEVGGQPSTAELEAFVEQMQAQVEQMRACCADPEQNVPLGKEAFAPTESPAVCRHCTFRQLCGRA
jgi:hypothetical protein